METFLFSVIAFGLAMLLLSVGAIFGRRYLRGSCGGLANRRDEQGHVICGCGAPPEGCERTPRPAESERDSHSPQRSARE